MNLPALIGLGSAAAFLIFIVLWWNRERIRRAIAEKQLEQSKKDTELNRKANANLAKQQKAIISRIGSAVNPNDPWAGLRREPKVKSTKLCSGPKT